MNEIHIDNHTDRKIISKAKMIFEVTNSDCMNDKSGQPMNTARLLANARHQLECLAAQCSSDEAKEIILDYADKLEFIFLFH